MQTLLIVYHSQSGTTEAMARAVIDGARDDSVEGVEVRVCSPLETDAGEVRAAHGIILGTPENFGYMSGALKYFFDHVYYPCLEHTEALPYALFIRAGNDGTGALTSVQRIVAGLQWKEAQPPLVVAGSTDPDDYLPRCRELGLTMAAGLEPGGPARARDAAGSLRPAHRGLWHPAGNGREGGYCVKTHSSTASWISAPGPRWASGASTSTTTA